MSNALAIAAVSRTLSAMLQNEMPTLDADLTDLTVTLQPPDLARKNVTKAQLNLFLYQVVHNAAWRNLDLPAQVHSGESALPALSLNLLYLVTAWGRGDSDNDALSHRVLACAMSVLHDHALLAPDDIRNALPGNDLANQVERVRIVLQTISVEELSKLWTAFATSYRISAAYEAAVVLIDSHAPARSPLPVLQRGSGDRGAIVITSAAPVLDALVLPHAQSAVQLGDDVLLEGSQLAAAGTLARFSSPRLDAPIDVAPTPGGAPEAVRVHFADSSGDPDALSRWAPGIYTVALVTQQPGMPALVSNELPLALAPTITMTPLAAPAGAITVNVRCAPRIRDGQRVFLLFGDGMVPPASVNNPADLHQPTALAFKLSGVKAGTYTVRLRVDGADSIPVDYSGATPAFATNQQVKVT